MKDRKKKIKELKSSIEKHETELFEALKTDLNKSESESLLHEIYPLKKEVEFILSNLHHWTDKRIANTPIALIGTSHYVQAEPKGRVLIISPWNFPVILTLRPLFSAIAAGNTVVVKPSEHTPNCSHVIKNIIESVFTKDEVRVVTGGPKVAAKLTKEPFDHICFTGGTEIGKLVMKAAAETLCSVTLELGGKSPTIVDSTANLKETAKRVAWGRFLNAGQVCIAPDYLLIEEKNAKKFTIEFSRIITSMYGENPIDSEDLGCIVNEKHFKRIINLIKSAVKDGAKLHVPGGVLELGAKKRKISPCFLTNCTTDMTIMKEEIFGPVLPILTWNNEDDIYDIIELNRNPLALYIFSNNRNNIKKYIANTKAGSTAINDVVIQIVNPELGFGGIGNSGMGRSNGKAGFDEFSNLRSFVDSKGMINALPLTFPPFTGFKKSLVRFISKWL